MALTPGTRLGSYEITAQIGVGGMGEVYRATDTNLKRQVAIKVLPASVAGDAERLARFQREAEVLAALNHPHIAAIHGLEKSDGMTALVMELVEGDDLSQRIARGALPIDEALPIAKQIAEALEAAHEQGIIHRDLKPANIKVRADGTVKVLDFGLAKAMEPAGAAAAASASMSPTITTPAMTQAGMILGTAAYMAPEQARGAPVDKRADIWAFGVVLWEMLTGQRLFEGATVSDTLAAVLRAEPDWAALPPTTPAVIQRLLRRCLAKDRKRRLDSAVAARLEIEEAQMPSAPSSAVAAQPRPGPRSTWSRALPWGVAGIALAGLLLTLAVSAPWRTASSPAGAELRFTPFSFESGGQISPVWSPDGKAVAFAARQNETDPYQIYVRYLDAPVPTPITRLAAGATPIAWTSAGQIVFRSTQAPAGLWSISPVGGEPQPLHAIRTEREAASASVSRDGSALAWWGGGDDGVFTVWIASPPGAEPTAYAPDPFASRNSVAQPTVNFSPDGTQLLLIRNAAEGFEAWLLPYPASAANPPHRVLERVPMNRGGSPTASWMPDNRHVVLSADGEQLQIADTTSGTFVRLAGGTTAQRFPAVSPDGSGLVFAESAIDYDVVSVDLATAAVAPLIATQRSEQMPAWASGSAALVYVTNRSGGPEIWLHTPGQLDRPLVTARDFPPDTTAMFVGPILSPDATRVIYTRLEQEGTGRAWMSAVAGGSPVRLVKTPAERDWPGSWSPDGNWFVYLQLRDGTLSLNKVKTTGQADPEVLTASIRRSFPSRMVPVWSPSGDWILYQGTESGGGRLTSPDGKTTRDLGAAEAYAFSADGRTMYGLRRLGDNRLELISTGINGGGETIIGSLRAEYAPAVAGNPSVRLSLAPDGKSLAYSTVKNTSNLWLLEGLDAVVPAE